jgi:hypothetical protein
LKSAVADLNSSFMEKVSAMNLLLSTVAVTVGLFVAASPTRAAQIWGWNHFDKLAPKHRALYLRWYRAFGIILCLGGVLFAVDLMMARGVSN